MSQIYAMMFFLKAHTMLATSGWLSPAYMMQVVRHTDVLKPVGAMVDARLDVVREEDHGSGAAPLLYQMVRVGAKVRVSMAGIQRHAGVDFLDAKPIFTRYAILQIGKLDSMSMNFVLQSGRIHTVSSLTRATRCTVGCSDFQRN